MGFGQGNYHRRACSYKCHVFYRLWEATSLVNLSKQMSASAINSNTCAEQHSHAHTEESTLPSLTSEIFWSCLQQVMRRSSPNELTSYDKPILKVTEHDPILSWRKGKMLCSICFWQNRVSYKTLLDLRCRSTFLSLEVNIVGARQNNANSYLPRSGNQLTREHSSWRGRSERLILTAIKARCF